MQHHAGKNIVVFADGTGNGASAVSKTNVWRLYRALDTGVPGALPGGPRQVAFYIDGVGTSSFRPLALLGSVFGIGVKRNVLEMYKYICRTYEPGDRIYAFGFSRGAFTARLLCSFIANEGLVQSANEDDLARAAVDAYRAYRRRFKLPLLSRKDTSSTPQPQRKVGIVDRLRDVRDVALKAWRRLLGTHHKPLPPHRPRIAFLGVWDTVSAYGLPFDELTRGIDNWVWPLSMPNYELSPAVECARHALALDEERDSFQPLLWDENKEPVPPPGTLPDRVQQVWFAGVHSNVGGGYADDTLSLVPFQWMMDESAKKGLRFLPPDAQEPRPQASPFGRRYDSRTGIAAYYRYQPRKLSARLLTPDPTTKLVQDPNRRGRGFLQRILVHESVLQRIEAGTDRYAPIALPAAFDVVGARGIITTVNDPGRAACQEWVWNDVWRRRVNYFLIVIVSLWLASLPVLQSASPPSACVEPQCALSPLIAGAGMVLPGVLQLWLDAFARAPGTAISLFTLVLLLLARSTALERRIRDGARELWAMSLGLALAQGAPKTKAGLATQGPRRGVFGLRTSRAYQRFFQSLKWRIAPGVFGAGLLGAALASAIAILGMVGSRWELAIREEDGTVCQLQQADTASSEPREYATSRVCWNLARRVEKGRRYKIDITVTSEWRDREISADPRGFGNDKLPLNVRLGAFLSRRTTSERWFQPVLRIADSRGKARLQGLEFRCACGAAPARQGAVFTAEFEAQDSGEASLFVNDAIVGFPGFTKVRFGLTTEMYDNNEGRATVELTELASREPTNSAAPWWRFW